MNVDHQFLIVIYYNHWEITSREVYIKSNWFTKHPFSQCFIDKDVSEVKPCRSGKINGLFLFIFQIQVFFDHSLILRRAQLCD